LPSRQEATHPAPKRPLTATENATRLLPEDSDLAAVIDAWDRLPEALKAGITARLNRAYDEDDTKVINQLTSQRRGLLRELGLTLQPSRSRVNGHRVELPSKWDGILKVGQDDPEKDSAWTRPFPRN